MSTGDGTTTIRRPAPVDAAATTVWPRVLWMVGTVLLATMVLHVAALLVLGGAVTGPVSLRKPATFAETGWLVAWSVALILPRLRAPAWQQHVIAGSAVLFGVGETAIIGFQAWRGVPSHYNFSTPLDTVLMRGAAAGTAGVFLLGTLVLLAATVRATGLPAGVRLGVLAGIVVLLVGCVVGFVMIVNNSGVYQGTLGAGFAGRAPGYNGPDAATVGPEFVLIRPSTAGGDLVLPHAIGVHGLVLLAVPALLLERAGVPARRLLLLVTAAVTAVGAALAILLVQALRGLPLDQLSVVALGVLAVSVLKLLAVGVVVARAVLSTRSSRGVS